MTAVLLGAAADSVASELTESALQLLVEDVEEGGH